MTRHRLGAALAGALLVLAPACGSDEDGGSDAGAEVEGRAPTSGAPTTEDAPDDGAADDEPDASPPSSADDSTTAPAPTVAPLAEVAVTLTPVATLDAPTKMVARPGSDLAYVAQQAGLVVALDPTAPDAEPTEALNLTAVTLGDGEQGLLGLAFSLDGDTLFVHHSGLDGETRVASFAMDGDVADPDSRVDLLTVAQPFVNHNGGDIVVGPDEMLWIGLGDGGAGDDPDLRAQDPDDLLGKVLRIDPSTSTDGLPYGIPADNPFADGGGRPEVAVVGVRNPWRLRFDEATGDLWVADVGQNQLEEIDHLPAGSILGANLGWSRYEGSQEYLPSHPLGPGAVVGPVFEMDHADEWCSVSGGFVYRGEAVPDLDGAYLFGDFCRPGLSAIRLGADGVDSVVLDDAMGSVVSIDAGPDGEAYVLSLDGTISRVDPA